MIVGWSTGLSQVSTMNNNAINKYRERLEAQIRVWKACTTWPGGSGKLCSRKIQTLPGIVRRKKKPGQDEIPGPPC